MQVVEVFSREYLHTDTFLNNNLMPKHVMSSKNSSHQREEEVFQELRRRWLQDGRTAYGLMSGKEYWFVHCPRCMTNGATMCTGSQGNRVYVCPECRKCFPMGELVKHYAPDLSEILWGRRNGIISGRPTGKRASNAHERKRWAQEQRKRFLSAPGDSADSFGNGDGC